MTAFAGVVELAPGGLRATEDVAAALGARLSRHPGEVVRAWRGPGAIVHRYHVDAWGDGEGAREGDGRLLVVCGDPAFGEATSRQAGIDLLAAALARDPLAALAATTAPFTLCVVAPGEALVATDRFGARPVFWARRGDAVAFATSYRALRDALAPQLTVDARAVRETVLAGQCLGDRTLFVEIRVLRPGHLLRAGGGRLEVVRYHDWSRVPARAPDRDAALAAAHAAFLRAIRRRSYAPRAEAFLSGGLDSRCVVAGLLEAGVAVDTFNSSYPGSADHRLGEAAARHFGTNHHTDLRDPVASLRHTLATFANYGRRARDAFPRRDGRPAEAGRVLWSGDGGSVLMGHVYLADDAVRAFAEGPITADLVRGRLRSRGHRVVRGSRRASFLAAAAADVAREIATIACPREERRLYLYYVLNNQARHVYWNLEQVDRTRIELISPFFDAPLVEVVLGLPVAWFLRHDFYNDWLGRFAARPDAVPWQVYPGHLPGPHPPQADLRDQWRDDFHGRRARCAIHREIAARVLRHRGRFTRAVLDRRWLALCWLALALGRDACGHEVRAANKLSAELDRPI